MTENNTEHASHFATYASTTTVIQRATISHQGSLCTYHASAEVLQTRTRTLPANSTITESPHTHGST